MEKNNWRSPRDKSVWQGFLLTSNKFLGEGIQRELQGSNYQLLGWSSGVKKFKELLKIVQLDFLLIAYPEWQHLLWEIQPSVAAEVLLLDSAKGCLLEIQEQTSLVQQLDKIRDLRLLGSRPLRIHGDELYLELAKKTEFTEKERQILHYLSYGYTYDQISEVTQLTTSTIKSYVFDLRTRLNAHDKAHLVAISFRSGLVV
jgi:DNA-binding CsgD family transcriptional regulator